MPTGKVQCELLNLSDRPVMSSLQSKNLRSCVDCRKRDNPTALLRTVSVEGSISPDPGGVAPGRGAWVHMACVERAVERGTFGRAFRQSGALDGSELISFVKKQISLKRDELDAKDMKLR